MSADGPDSHDDDSEASDEDVAEWDPQPGDAPPLAPGVSNLAEGVLDADVKEVYSRLLADQVGYVVDLSAVSCEARRLSGRTACPVPYRVAGYPYCQESGNASAMRCV